MTSRRLTVTIMAVATVCAIAPVAHAATKKKPPKGPAPGSIVKTITGSYAHGYPRLTQPVWLNQKCASTAAAGQETNNLSASIVPIAAYVGKELNVVFTQTGSLPSADSVNVQFFDKNCQRIDENDGKPDTGQWNAQNGQVKQIGMIPPGAVSLLLQSGQGDTQFETSTEAMNWQLVVRWPLKTDPKPVAMTIDNGLPL